MLKNQRAGLPDNHAIYTNGHFKLDVLHREAEAYSLRRLAPHETRHWCSSFHVFWRPLAVLFSRLFQPHPLRHSSKNQNDPRADRT